MRTKLSVCAAALTESAWLTALALVPVFFNPHSVRIFDEDKALLLRSIALCMFAGCTIWALEAGVARWPSAVRARWRLPMVRPALLLTTAIAAATMASIDPSTSFWGAYVRAQGLCTWLSYLAVFAAVLLLVRTRGQVERVVTVVLLASVPPSTYAVCQHFGLEPIRWAVDTQARVIGTAGNAIFIGAYVIMVVPLTLARLLQQAGTVRATPRPAAVMLLAAYVVLLVLQILTLLYSESRGPFLGLAAGLTCFFVVYAAHRRRRLLTTATVAVIAAATLFLAVFNAPGSPLAAWRALPYVGRLGQLLDVGGGTGKVRVLIWEGATRLLAAHPERLPLGHGPDAMFLAYPPFFPPELSYYERRGVVPDRSHNESFDVLIMTGIAGLGAGLVVYLALFSHALGWLGMTATGRERRALMATMMGGAAAGALLPVVLDGSLRFAGVGLPIGLVTGVAVYVLARALASGAPVERKGDDLLLIGLVSAVVAHFVEVHFGIAITITRLYFWTYVALIVVLGVPLVRRPQPDMPERSWPLAEERLALTPTVGLLLALIWFGFHRGGTGVTAAPSTLWIILGATWLMGACLIAAADTRKGTRAAALGAYASTTGGLWLTFVGLHSLTGLADGAGALDPTTVRRIGHATAWSLVSLCAFILLLLMVQTIIQTLRQRPLPDRWARTPLTAMAAAGVVGLALALALVGNIQPLRADVLAKQAQIAEARQQRQAARLLYEDARHLQPRETTYATNLGRVLTELARRATGEEWSVREGALLRAQDVLSEAEVLMPRNADHPRNLAILYRTWATLSPDATRTHHVAEALACYRRAVALAPNNAELRNEWATLQIEQGDAAGALDLINQSLTIDPRFAKTWYLRAQAHLALDRPAEALADYDRALMLDPGMLAGWSGKALTLAEQGRTGEAIAANQAALQLAPNDLITHRNLALLFQRQGERDRARIHAESALALAQGADREALEQFIRDLDQAGPTDPHENTK